MMPTPTPIITVAPHDPSAATRDWISTFATVGAVLVALAIAVAPIIWRRIRRPKLVAEVGDREPNVRFAHKMDGPNAWFLRMTVRNKGKTEARRVRVTLIDWYVHEPVGEYEWARNDTDPAALHWVSMTHAREQVPRPPVPSWQTEPGPLIRPTPPEVNLAPELFDLVDLADWSNGYLRLILDDNRPRGFIQQAPQGEREFMLTVFVTAENASAITRTVCFRVDSGKGFTDIGFCDPPKRSRQTGWLSMLDMVQKEVREKRERPQGPEEPRTSD